MSNKRHYQFATNQASPEWERRLLQFSESDNDDNSNPEAKPIKQEDGTPEKGNKEPTSTVDNTETRSKISDALAADRISIREDAYEQLGNMKSILQTMQKYKENPQIKEAFVALESCQEDLTARLHTIVKLLDKQEEWEAGILEPSGYQQSIENYITINSGQGYNMANENQYDVSATDWIKKETEEKRAIMDKLNKALEQEGYDSLIEEAKDIVERIKNGLSEYKTEIDRFTEGINDNQQEEEREDDKGESSIFTHLPTVKFVSALDIYNAGKKYVEAVKNAWEKHGHRVSAEIAGKVGSALQFLPLGKETSIELASEREQKNEEEKKTQKEYMEQQNATFDIAKTMLSSTRNNANKFNGVMEYMAEKGWLYDLNVGAKTLFGMQIPMPGGWNEETLSAHLIRMISSDSDGQENQKKRVQNIVGTAPYIDPIIEFLEEELDRHNYWGAYAALEIAMNKGKIGESGTWVTATLLKHIRNNTEARKYIPIDLYDQLGNLGISHPAWTPTFIKLDRKNLKEWAESDGEIDFRHAGILGETIIMIEKEIEEKFGSTEKEIEDQFGKGMTLNHLVGQVLAAQTVTNKQGTQSITIFSDTYSTYRKSILDTKATIEPGKADDDFYGNISDALLIGSDGLRSILSANTQGAFAHLTKANSYIESIINLHKELHKNENKEVLANYQREMRNKLNIYFEEDVLRHAATATGWRSRTTNGKNTLQQLLEAQLVSEDIYKKVTEGGE